MTKTIKTFSKTQSTNLNWDTNEIFEASLMFPTEHIQSESALKALTDEEFSDLTIGILFPCQPLTGEEKSAMVKSVHAKNRLRVYFQALQIVTRHAKVVDEVQDDNIEDVSLSEAMAHNGYSIREEGATDFVDEEFPEEE